MAIQGSLKTFSLPELFQMIESGRKSGRLTFTPRLRDSNSSLAATYELWFDKGNFITIVNSRRQEFLTSKIINMGWVDLKVVAQSKISCSPNQSIGEHLFTQNLINQWHIDTLFLAQKREVIKLFKIDSAEFNFEELEDNNSILSDNASFPYEEMTGQQMAARELSLEGMRKYPPSSARFLDEIPPDSCGLQRLVKHCNLQFSTLEKYLCNMADGSISLRKIAQEMGVSVDKVQTTALSMILAGLVEEVPVVITDFNLAANPTYRSSSVSAKPIYRATAAKDKSKVSNSLLKNLTNFLKNNF